MFEPATGLSLEVANERRNERQVPALLGQHQGSQETGDAEAERASDAAAETLIEEDGVRMELECHREGLAFTKIQAGLGDLDRNRLRRNDFEPVR